MKQLLLGILFITSLHAQLMIEQNIKALYKDVQLNTQENTYIVENRDKNIQALQETAQRYINSYKNSNDRQKNVVEFTLTKDQTIQDIHLLIKSNKEEIDTFTKDIISNAKLVKSTQNIKLRFIFIYDFLDKKNLYITPIQKNPKPVIEQENNDTASQDISRGTTKFASNFKPYVRFFETSAEGVISGDVTPALCATLKLLTNSNKKVSTGLMPWSIHAKLPKGRYTLLIKTKQECDINLQYP